MKITLTNFKCWKNNSFDLGEEGITLLSGKSGVGKTSILEAIVFALFGTGTKLQLFGSTSCKVMLQYKELNIIRTKGPNRLVVNDIYEDDAAQAIINKRFGDYFDMVGYMQQNSYNSFVLLSPLEKLSFLERFAFTDTDLSIYKSKVKKSIQERHEEFISVISKLEMINNILQTKEKPQKVENCFEKYNLSNLQETLNKKYKKLSKGLETGRELITSLEKKLYISRTVLDNIEGKNIEKVRLNERINQLVEEVDSKFLQSLQTKNSFLTKKLNDCQKMKELKTKLDKYQENEERYNTLFSQEKIKLTKQQSKIKEYFGRISKKDIENNISELEEYIPSLKKAISYKKKIDSSEVKEEIDIHEIDTQIDELKNKLERCKISQEIYTCPSCNEKLLIDDNQLVLYQKDINVSVSKYNSLEKHLSSKVNERKSFEQHNKEVVRLKEKISIWQKEIDDFTNTYDSNLDEDSNELEQELFNMKEEYEAIKSFEKELKDIENKLRLGNLSTTLISLEKELKTSDKITSDMVDIDLINKEEEIREEILLNTNKLATIKVKKDELNDSYKRIKACNEYLERENGKISEFSSLTDIEEKIQANKTKLLGYEKKLVDINIKLEKLGKYLNYKKELKEYNIFVNQREELLVEEKEKRECLSAANTLKNMIQKAESLAISNVINNINEHVQTYIELFFEDNPMSIQLL